MANRIVTRAIERRFHVVAITQVFNEVRKGNLGRFFEHLSPLVDAIVVYDDGSTDGTFEYLLAHTPHVIRSPWNDFSGELTHRQRLLDHAITLNPDYVLWLDADEVLSTQDPEDVQRLCAWSAAREVDGVELHELNLWRSDSWRRLDSSFDLGWFVRLWRVTPTMRYEAPHRGLHRLPYPPSIRRIERSTELSVLHYGFADERNLAYKYLTYRSHGQRGYDMLDRLISEETLVVERVSAERFPRDLRGVDPEPSPLSFAESLAYVDRYRDEFMRPAFSIICPFRGSIEEARSVHERLLRYTDMEGKEFLLVAGRTDHGLLDDLRSYYLPHVTCDALDDWSNGSSIEAVLSVLRLGASHAGGDFLVFIDGKTAFSAGWFEALWEAYDGESAVASRVVRAHASGRGRPETDVEFEADPSDVESLAADAAWAKSLPGTVEGLVFTPFLVRREVFLAIDSDREHPRDAELRSSAAVDDAPAILDDDPLGEALRARGVRLRTALHSVVYHLPPAEAGPSSSRSPKSALVAVCDESLDTPKAGSVLSGSVMGGLPSLVQVDRRVLAPEVPFAQAARELLRTLEREVAVIVQNATFIDAVDPDLPTIAVLRDDLRAAGLDTSQQEANLRAARFAVTDSRQTAMSYAEYDFEVIPAAVDSDLYRPLDKERCRAMHGLPAGPIGILLGASRRMDSRSGIRECIEAHPAVTWLLVDGGVTRLEAANVLTFDSVTQVALVGLLNCADWAVSPVVDTSDPIALAACLCDVPVVAARAGIFGELSADERDRIGVFTDDLADGVLAITQRSFSPRQVILTRGWTAEGSIRRWRSLLEAAMQDATAQRVGFVGRTVVGDDGEPTRCERSPRRLTYAPSPIYSYAPESTALRDSPASSWRGPRGKVRLLSPRRLTRAFREHGIIWIIKSGLERFPGRKSWID